MTINFKNQKNQGTIGVCDGKEYAFVEEAEYRGNDVVGVVIGEDEKLYYAKYEIINPDAENFEDTCNWEEIESIELIDSFDGLYDKYNCHYDD